MAKIAQISVRVPAELKKETGQILSRLGLTHSEAIHLFLQLVKVHKGLPFEAPLPDDQLIEYLKRTATGFTAHEELLEEYGLSNPLGKSQRPEVKKAQ